MVGSAPAGMAAVPGPSADLTVAAVSPATGDVVGVAAPIEVTFAEPVTNRARAERSIAITSSKTPSGQFTWLSNQVVQWIPDGFWPAHSPISVAAGDFKTNFETGSAVVGVADIDAHTFTVKIDDVVVRRCPHRWANPSIPTPNGTFTALAKEKTRGDGLPHHRHPAERPGGLQAHRLQRGPHHVGRRLRPQRAVVCRVAGLLRT